MAYIKTYMAKFGYAPSVRGIAERFDMTVMGAWSHLRLIEQKGYIKRTKGIARGLVVLE